MRSLESWKEQCMEYGTKKYLREVEDRYSLDMAVLLSLIDTSSEPDVGRKALYNILSHLGRLAVLDSGKMHFFIKMTQKMLDDIMDPESYIPGNKD